MERGRASPAVDSFNSSDSGVFEDAEDGLDLKLKANSPVAEILDAMKHPVHGKIRQNLPR